MSLIVKVRCPVCGVEFTPHLDNEEAKKARTGGFEKTLQCPNGHAFTALIKADTNLIYDCEIRDWERFGLLPAATQQAILEAIQGGRVPRELIPLMTRLREAGIVICT